MYGGSRERNKQKARENWSFEKNKPKSICRTCSEKSIQVRVKRGVEIGEYANWRLARGS